MVTRRSERREQTSGSFVVLLWTGQSARFNDMPRARAWAESRLSGQPSGSYAAFYRAPVAPGRSDAGDPWTEPFHVLVVNDYGHIVVAGRENWPDIPEQPQAFPHRGTRESRSPREPRKEIEEIIEDLHSWLPNYDHEPDSYPDLLFRLLASLPGGDRLQEQGYEPFESVGWQEADQLGRVLVAIQDKRDVEDIVRSLTDEEEDIEEVDAGSRSRRR